MAKCVTRDKRILNPANGDYVQILVFFHWRKHDARSIRRARSEAIVSGVDAVMVLMRTLDNPYGTAPDTGAGRHA